MRKCRAWLVAIASAAAFMGACHKGGTPTSAPLESTAVAVRNALGKEPFNLVTENHKPGSPNLVVLIGENHASVAAQTQLATVLERLRAAKLVDAVLVEGSNGALPTAAFAAKASAAAQGASLDAFWKRQLEWGNIAGYEYFELRHASVPAIGIEDMTAKLAYEIASVGEEKAHTIRVEALGLARESLELAAEESTKLGGDAAEVRREIDLLRDATSQFAESLQESMPALRNYADETGVMLHKQAEYQALVAELRDPIEEYQALVKQIQGLKDQQGSLESLAQKADTIRTRHATQFATLATLVAELENFQARHEELQAQIKPLIEAAAEKELAAYDAFFRGANRVRREAARLAAKAPLADSARHAVAAVDRFFINERKRAEDLNLKDAKQTLLERDAAMATNVANYLADHHGKIAVVVVGYAHLRGMEEQLANRNISFISGGLSGNSTSQYWEIEAWHKRRAPVPTVFSTLKEVSRFLDPRWPDEMKELLTWSQQLGATPTNRGTLKQGNEQIVHVGKHLADQQTLLGEQVTARGPAGLSDHFFEVWDRNKGRTLVKDLTSESTLFAYAFQNQSNAQYQVFTRARQQSLQEFMEAAPSPNAKYVVLFHEPDVVEESGVPMSELWTAIRPAGAGGNGKPPRPPGNIAADSATPDPSSVFGVASAPKTKAGGGHDGAPPPRGPWHQAAFWDGGRNGGRKYTGLLRTNDPRRAAIKLAKLERQNPLDAADITVLDQAPALENIPFTPRDGEAAGLVVLIARNEAEFRSALQRAGEARKFENKQVALITCGNAFRESMALREMMLAAGALMVWMPNRQISEIAGKKLAEQLQLIRERAAGQNMQFRDIDALMNHAVGELRTAEPTNVDLFPLTHSGSFVLVLPKAGTSQEPSNSLLPRAVSVQV